MEAAELPAHMIRLLLTPEEAAQALGISRATLYPMLMRKQIPSIRIGGSRRIPIAALQQFVEDQLDAPVASVSQLRLVRHGKEG